MKTAATSPVQMADVEHCGSGQDSINHDTTAPNRKPGKLPERIDGLYSVKIPGMMKGKGEG